MRLASNVSTTKRISGLLFVLFSAWFGCGALCLVFLVGWLSLGFFGQRNV